MKTSLEQLKVNYPLIDHLIALEEILWLNPKMKPFRKAMSPPPFSQTDIDKANSRLKRFAPYIAKAFPETEQAEGIIESPVKKIPAMRNKLQQNSNPEIKGEFILKCDNELPISGSIKARGGIYEVLKHAENLAKNHGMIKAAEDYSVLDSERFYQFFSNYSIAVGSTGNLGLSIGIISAKLGFHVTVHMSAEAKQWKKDLLRNKGVQVIEYVSDYSKAVEQGRKEAEQDSNCHFIDDENSTDLFLGYAVAASRLKVQLKEQDIPIDKDHPLFVYLPCGVGGGPGGVAFGLKMAFQENVHFFFAEPTHSPAMLLGLMTGLHDKISVQDIGVDNITAADGLAVGRPSGFVGKIMEPFLSGSYTVTDEKLFLLLKDLADEEGIYLEPSALAGLAGPSMLYRHGQKYLENHQLTEKMNNATHLIWATGGSMVPEDIMESYYERGAQLKSLL